MGENRAMADSTEEPSGDTSTAADTDGTRTGETGGPAAGASVTVAGERYELVPGQSFTFGRGTSCDVCLDATDVGISRLAGSVDCIDRVWFVTNRSSSRPLSAIDVVGFRTVLAPGRRMVIDGQLSVIVEGQIRRHELVLVAPGTDDLAAGVPVPDVEDGMPTEVGGGVNYSHEDRQALVALFAGYLQPFPRYDPTPKTYADAAKALGWPSSTLRKRVEYLRNRLVKAGVPNLQGERAMEALAEHVIATGVITRDDLTLLP
jgi:hypothetical protein